MNPVDTSQPDVTEPSPFGLRLAVWIVRILALPIVLVAVLTWLVAVLLVGCVAFAGRCCRRLTGRTLNQNGACAKEAGAVEPLTSHASAALPGQTTS